MCSEIRLFSSTSATRPVELPASRKSSIKVALSISDCRQKKSSSIRSRVCSTSETRSALRNEKNWTNCTVYPARTVKPGRSAYRERLLCNFLSALSCIHLRLNNANVTIGVIRASLLTPRHTANFIPRNADLDPTFEGTFLSIPSLAAFRQPHRKNRAVPLLVYECAQLCVYLCLCVDSIASQFNLGRSLVKPCTFEP